MFLSFIHQFMQYAYSIEIYFMHQVIHMYIKVTNPLTVRARARILIGGLLRSDPVASRAACEAPGFLFTRKDKSIYNA